ncbi:trehalose-6-phosphate synthase [Heliorestis acidaminivorans]|uniref:Trehalose-6-phosphate synthase n=1 Tax=Heliorestis acidaminivorans TaxID=553427 RepID=A0A6I0EXC9_9FIRM|nr:trehalose-6-phosphate synthase [Heliorestis acidaminivorans]KAB2951201.1 trehalose-6-phosphate synthase [Heliorestis acidaminivorans]
MGLLKPLSYRDRRLVIASNRGPLTLRDSGSKGLEITPSVSGLVSALNPIIDQEGGAWVGWGGRLGKPDEIMGKTLPLTDRNDAFFHEVILTEEEVEAFYEGISNSCLWPLCHNFVEKALFDAEQWQNYRSVNIKYAQTLLQKSQPRDLIWIHDYHLALVPTSIRLERPQAQISLFWHIPFPAPEIFATLPWARELLKGLLDCNLIAFHTESYVRNFLITAEELLGAKVDHVTGSIFWAGRKIIVAAYPIGIDWRDFESLASKPEIRQKAHQLKQASGGDYLILGVDRLDYTKGIPERLKAIEWLFENHPEYKRKITFIQIAVPSRTQVKAYQSLRREVEETVGRINGRFTEDHIPVRYLFRPLRKDHLVTHYLAADMCLVTPLRDGLNLVAKEYVATNGNYSGTLLLSPFAGAANQLKEALQANPYSPQETAEQILKGLLMAEGEKKRRLHSLYKSVKEQDISWWWKRIKQAWLTGSTITVSPKATLAEDSHESTIS